MVDVSDKQPGARTAVATGVFRTTEEVIGLLRRDGLPKGDALATARIAGIMGAKRTPDLVPLCHPIALTGVTVDLEIGGAGASEVRITATVRTTDRTGVEMEALTAVTVAGHRDRGERLHLHSRAVGRPDGGGDPDLGCAGATDLQVDRHTGQRDRMAQRHQVGRALGAHDPGDPGG